MLNRISLIAAACMAASAGLFVANAQMVGTGHDTAQTVTLDRGAANVVLPAGITSKDLNSDKAIEKLFKNVAEDAMSKTGFDNLIGNLVDQDRDRINKGLSDAKLSSSNVDGEKNKRLTDVIANLDGAWQSKFNAKFNIDYTKVYTADFLRIMTGEVNDPQLLLGKWPVDAQTLSAGSNSAGKINQSDVDQAKGKYFGGDVNLEKGRNVAIAHITGSHGMSGLTASLIHESGGWKFDVPNSLTGQRLYDNLVANLNYVDLHKDQLPSDVNDAYRMVSHAVTAALYDVRLSNETVINR